MAQNQTPQKFRPERPIYLNEQNTNFRTKDSVLEAIERLRMRGWLCTYAEKSRPFHMSFNDVKQFEEFKSACKDESVVLHSPVMQIEEIEELDLKEKEGQSMPDAVANSSSESPEGVVHIDSDAVSRPVGRPRKNS